MPLTEDERLLLGLGADGRLDHAHQRLEVVPREKKKIGKLTIIALILNRTIGSGIFLTPGRVLAGTGCVSGAMFMWTLGGLISICGLYVWLECGLSMPQRDIRGVPEPQGVGRSGGEKNYLEFIFARPKALNPHLRVTCSYAIMFILMYNLSGNGISFGEQFSIAVGLYDPSSNVAPPRGPVIGFAIAALSVVVVLHAMSRSAGIYINNTFAFFKVNLLLVIVALGIAKSAGRFGGSGHIAHSNFTKDVWSTNVKSLPSWSDSLMVCLYAYSGYEQPFYILAETKSPRKYFPKYTAGTMLFALVLFLAVNISYLLVVDKNEIILQSPTGAVQTTAIATLFFKELFPHDHDTAVRATAGLIAFAIFGNLWVMTFTAARVKQEIAKEGVFGERWSLFFATSYRTPWGMVKQWMFPEHTDEEEDNDNVVEKAPTAAFGLHWLTSILLIAVTSPIVDPRKTYSALISLYTYVIIGILGFWVSMGLIMVKLQDKWHWQQRRRYKPSLSPAHAIIYCFSTAFLLIVSFIPSPRSSPYSEAVTGVPWYIVPAIGITAPFWGLIWYGALSFYESRIGRLLRVERKPYVVPDPSCRGEYIQKKEVVDVRRERRFHAKPQNDVEMDDANVWHDD